MGVDGITWLVIVTLGRPLDPVILAHVVSDTLYQMRLERTHDAKDGMVGLHVPVQVVLSVEPMHARLNHTGDGSRVVVSCSCDFVHKRSRGVCRPSSGNSLSLWGRLKLLLFLLQLDLLALSGLFFGFVKVRYDLGRDGVLQNGIRNNQTIGVCVVVVGEELFIVVHEATVLFRTRPQLSGKVGVSFTSSVETRQTVHLLLMLVHGLHVSSVLITMMAQA